MAKTGRPKATIDWDEFERLCFLQCSRKEIAYWFKCSEKTIERKCYEQYGESFVPVFEKKRIGGLVNLRRNLFKQSETNVAAAIFLAKNWLGMSDKQEIEHSGNSEKPIGVKYVQFDANTVAAAILEAQRLGLGPEILGGNGHRQKSDVLPAHADIQAAIISQSRN